MSELIVSPMEHTAALAIVTWRYPPPYDVYSMVDDPLTTAAFLCHAESGYYQLRDAGGVLVAFCCFGADAQVPGGDYAAPALDLGIGIRPDLAGRGEGMRYLGAVLAFARQRFQPPALRLTVAAFNQRAYRLYRRAGFHELQRFQSTYSGQEFIVMLREP